MYGDGWTPLMAAAVGGHVGIASQLLAAAGPALAAELVGVTNRYGALSACVTDCLPGPALLCLSAAF